MNIKTTIILAILLLAVGGYLFFTREGSAPPKTATEVTKVVVTSTEASGMTFVKDGDDWRMTVPDDAAADPDAVNKLIGDILQLKVLNKAEETDESKTGLDKPRYSVELSGKNNEVIYFGNRPVSGTGVYSRIEGQDTVNVVDAAILDRLSKPDDYKESKTITKVVVTSADGKAMTLEKTGDVWRMTAPVAAAAEPAEVSALIDGVLNLKISNEVDAAQAGSTGIDKPQYVVELFGKKNFKVSFGDKVPVGNGVYTKFDDKPSIGIVDAAILDRLDKQANAYRETKLVATPSLDIKQLVITTKTGKIALQKAGQDWKMTQPTAMPADSAAVTDLLNALTGLKAASFVEDSSERADDMKGNPPVISVAFSTSLPATQPAATAPVMTTVTFGAYDDVLKKHVYATVSSSPFVAKVDSASMTSFDKKPIELRDKRVADVNPAEVSRFTISANIPAATQPTSRPAKQSETTIERRLAGNKGIPFVATLQPATAPSAAAKFELPNAKKPSAWVRADGSDADENDVTEFLAALHPLRIDKYLESNPATTQPTASRYTVKLHTEAAGGAKGDVEIHFMDRGNDQPLIGEYNGLTFEAARTTLARFLEGDFKNKGGAGGPAIPQGHPPLDIQ